VSESPLAGKRRGSAGGGAAGALRGQVALVTGGSRGIGRAIAIAMGREGAFVFVNYRRDHRAARECVARVCEAGGKAEALRADVADPRDIGAMFSRITRHAPGLTILVNNAGIAPAAPAFTRVTLGIWNRTLATNLTGAFLCTQAAAQLMRHRRGGRIIFVGSVAARRGGTIGPHYAASKAALLGLMAWGVQELSPYGITVNVVAPGFVETTMTAAAYHTPAARARLAAQVPLGRVGTLEDIGAAVAFLAAPHAGYITGECLTIAGGR